MPSADEPVLDLGAHADQEFQRHPALCEAADQRDESSVPPEFHDGPCRSRRCDTAHRELLRNPFASF
jgi:hypothetical protein